MIVMENLSRVYRRGREEIRALDSLSLEIGQGELIGILGPSGSGKSTLMNLVGLLDRPTAGSITVNGSTVNARPRKEIDMLRRQEIGFVFQRFLLIPTMTALQNVMLPMYFAGTGRAAARERAEALLARVGLTARKHHLPGHMSGGEVQRVAVARALANGPSIVLADEPTGNLDSRSAREVFDLFREINTGGTTVCIVTHNGELAGLLPRTITLKDGRVIGDVQKSAC